MPSLHKLRKYQGRLAPKCLVFIDETWAKLGFGPTVHTAGLPDPLRPRASYGR